MHGPSRTTVEKVVALADMSPGIVRFYFESKDAMLVASLAYLAAEFEERVMKPVAALKETPVRALERLVELYLDAQIASPRKVSVWYSFWGEASSRQEYYEICGRKDDEFASLVRELVGRLIAHSAQSHLDADAVALGLIGVLEVLWQEIAFQEEARIDRTAAKQRSLAFLRSVFPAQFAAAQLRPAADPLPLWAYCDGRLLSLERERLLRPAWQFASHEGELRRAGDFLTLELATERALLLRDRQQIIRAFRNSCRKRPHALVTAPRGHFSATISCAIHALEYGLDGALRSGSTSGDLLPLDLACIGPFILLRSPGPALPVPNRALWESLSRLRPAGSADVEVAANWKLLIEQWLEGAQTHKAVQRTFISPNELLQVYAGGALLLQLIPQSPGRCRVRRLDFATAAGGATLRGARQAAQWLAQDIEIAESIQKGLATGSAETADPSAAAPALAEFRALICALLPQAHTDPLNR